MGTIAAESAIVVLLSTFQPLSMIDSHQLDCRHKRRGIGCKKSHSK
jgi:hypothetical protein